MISLLCIQLIISVVKIQDSPIYLNYQTCIFRYCYLIALQTALFIKTNVILSISFLITSNSVYLYSSSSPCVSTRYPILQVKYFGAILNFPLSQNHLCPFFSPIQTFSGSLHTANSCRNKYLRDSSFSIPISIVEFWLVFQWIFKYFICFQFSRFSMLPTHYLHYPQTDISNM